MLCNAHILRVVSELTVHHISIPIPSGEQTGLDGSVFLPLWSFYFAVRHQRGRDGNVRGLITKLLDQKIERHLVLVVVQLAVVPRRVVVCAYGLPAL